MSDVLHVDTQLVCASGSRQETDVGEFGKTFNRFVERSRFARVSTGRADLHFLPLTRMDTNVGLNVVAVEIQHPVDDGPVLFLDGALLELGAQFVVDLVILGNDNDAGCVAIEAMERSRGENWPATSLS